MDESAWDGLALIFAIGVFLFPIVRWPDNGWSKERLIWLGVGAAFLFWAVQGMG
jgi:hypothetical protein